ncbi:twin-arginine translocation signal domain-containing protein [Parazoarcus communis]|nr:twin-arginine translocation signal domain-containing protein [Parazoarcus communis]
MSNTSSRPPMRVIEKRVTLSRRGFLKGGGMAALGVGALSTATLMMPADEALAANFKVLGAANGKTLLQLARDIFPHDRISDRYYLQALEPLEAQAAQDDKLKALLTEGVAALDRLAKLRFKKAYTELPKESDRLSLLYVIEHGAFFQKVKGHLVTGFYDNKAVWPLFGYEGSSWEKGGYINRGFDDIDWLDNDA